MPAATMGSIRGGETVIDSGITSAEYSMRPSVKSSVTGRTRWLELGCGHQLWPDWIPGQVEAARSAALAVGLDPDVDSLRRNRVLRHRVAGPRLPFRDGSCRLVTANM
jgi:hypothetical protein